ncbi:unnamed protein product [Citrullus colocynthis]|uniref:Uncharacterized protein n=1 Tax=Citrullus colocynthis TaxID=252529 RepID=A0ABP0XTF8_9ROSI
MATNVRGVVSTIEHAGRITVERTIRGSIICIVSVAAVITGTIPLAYTSSKHAILGVVRSSCGELRAYGIRVNCVVTARGDNAVVGLSGFEIERERG